MEVISLVIAIVALLVGCIALVIAVKKASIKEVVTKEIVKQIEYGPVEHPFVYDKKKSTYTLDGDLLVTGGVSCLKV